MSDGLVKNGSANAVLTIMPNNLDYADRGTTGMWSKNFIDKTPETILAFLKEQDYNGPNGHEDNKWDCEDRAYWGVTHARCKYPGLPIAVALGTAKGGPHDGKNHAVIVLWTKIGEDKYQEHFFDPDSILKRLVDFNPRAIIPFPVYRPNAIGGSRKDLAPFDDENQHPYIAKGAFVLDREYDLSKVNDIKKYLEGCKECPKPSGMKEEKIFNKYWGQSIEDKTFWTYTHARRHFWDNYKGNPIGLGFVIGLDKRKNKDGAVLVIWGENDSEIDYEYWDIDSKPHTIGKNDFEARIVVA